MLAPFRVLLVVPILVFAPVTQGQDRLADLQTKAVASANQQLPRAYHFGSQGAGAEFSNHSSHSNRLIPVYTFGNKIDLKSVTGPKSAYRDEAKVRKLFDGALPKFTLNPIAEYADQSDLYRVQKEATERGVKHLFIVWFDGMDWESTRAAAIVKSGKVYDSGKGSGLLFQDYDKGSPQFGSVVTTPTHNENIPNVETQTIDIPATSLPGGYDAEIAGPNPWTRGRLADEAPGYLKGQGATASEKARIQTLGRVVHAYTDSSTSAGEFATGRKAYNNGVNVTDDGAFVPTLFQQLQDKGWKVGTVTSVPFPHASPAGMYAHNVHRDDYQDLGRDMLGLRSVAQESNKEPAHPGLDVVIGTGFGKTFTDETFKKAKFIDVAGANVVAGNAFITAADLAAIDLHNGGKYVVVHTVAGVEGTSALNSAAALAAKGDHRLFGFFGDAGFDHLPYQTANGDFKPTPSLKGTFETYTEADLRQNPKLADMTDAALTVLAAGGKPFALFVEAGDVDWGLHDNNLDTAVGAVFSGEDAVARIIKWVETHSNWDDSALIVTSDHGHYLVIDDPKALIGTPRP